MALALINPKEDRRAGAKKSSSYDVEKQVKNYEKRLGSAKDEATDDRNWLEKALNLGQNQGLIKDIFEILNRPQNAIFSGISSAQKGEGFGAGFKKGITGEKRTEGKAARGRGQGAGKLCGKEQMRGVLPGKAAGGTEGSL